MANNTISHIYSNMFKIIVHNEFISGTKYTLCGQLPGLVDQTLLGSGADLDVVQSSGAPYTDRGE